MSRRKWNSMEQLEGAGAFLTPHDQGSNLRTLKHLSVSTPGISVQDMDSDDPMEEILAPEVPQHIPEENMEGDSPKPPPPARQRRFSRLFDIPEPLLQFYSCAIGLDILLQGVLYVTQNNLAFYSNVFGKVTKVIIPVSSIEKIQKSKTALIIPNAIHVHTTSERYAFASFMSRENAYTQMVRVWTSFLTKSCGSNVKVVEPLEGPQEGIRRSIRRDKISKTLSTDFSSAGTLPDIPLKKSIRKKSKRERKSQVMFADETDSVPILEEIIPDRLEVERKVSVSSSVTSAQSDEDEVEGSLPENGPQVMTFTEIDPRRYSDVSESESTVIMATPELPKKRVVSRTDKIILRLCYILILLLSASAVNLYFRIDAIIEADGFPEKVNIGSDLFDHQKLQHADMSNNILTSINETMKRIQMVQDVLAKFSANYDQERTGDLL